MSKNDMVMVPRDWVESTIGAGPGEPVCRSDIDLLKTALASEQHQGEPVALPKLKRGTCLNLHADIFADGWNAYHEEIAKLGPLYSHPMQGEPVGTLLIGEYFDNREIGEVDVQLDSKACDQLAEKYPGQSMQLYTHADPVEAERLRSELAETQRISHKEELRANRYSAQLAEAQALLREVHGGMWPSNPLTIKIGSHLSASADPSAPVELDERAEFEKACEGIWGFPSTQLCILSGPDLWKIWQARTALGRKP